MSDEASNCQCSLQGPGFLAPRLGASVHSFRWTSQSSRSTNERIAQAKLPAEVYDYFAGGAGEEWSLRANIAAFDRWVIRPRVLVGVEERDTSSDLLGTRVSFPVLVAPWAFQHMADPEGDVATARGTARAGTIMVIWLCPVAGP